MYTDELVLADEVVQAASASVTVNVATITKRAFAWCPRVLAPATGTRASRRR